jgi:hypothetical protein
MIRLLALILLLTIACDSGTNFEMPCGADGIEDILGTWYSTSQRAGIQPGYFVTDSTTWQLDRILTAGTRTTMDSLQVTIESHPGDRAFDPIRDRQTIYRLQYEPGSSPYGVLAYGTARFSIPECGSLVVEWVDNITYRLRKRE